jgi:hypothetical protein
VRKAGRSSQRDRSGRMPGNKRKAVDVRGRERTTVSKADTLALSFPEAKRKTDYPLVVW